MGDDERQGGRGGTGKGDLSPTRHRKDPARPGIADHEQGVLICIAADLEAATGRLLTRHRFRQRCGGTAPTSLADWVARTEAPRRSRTSRRLARSKDPTGRAKAKLRVPSSSPFSMPSALKGVGEEHPAIRSGSRKPPPAREVASPPTAPEVATPPTGALPLRSVCFRSDRSMEETRHRRRERFQPPRDPDRGTPLTLHSRARIRLHPGVRIAAGHFIRPTGSGPSSRFNTARPGENHRRTECRHGCRTTKRNRD